jgi:hypothetical protein
MIEILAVAKGNPDSAINKAMRELFDTGCRRFRTIRLPKNGDYARYRVIGWIS